MDPNLINYNQTTFNFGQNSVLITCGKCGSSQCYYQLKLISTNRSDIKFVPQIMVLCKECNSYIKFAAQTPQLIEAINKQLEGVIFCE